METTTTATYSGTGGQPVLSLGDKCAADTGGSVQAAGGGTCQYIKAGAMWQRAYHVLDYNNCSGLPSDCTPLKDKDAGRYTWDRQVAGSAPLTGGMGGPYYICSAFNNTGHACITLMTPDMAAVGPSYLPGPLYGLPSWIEQGPSVWTGGTCEMTDGIGSVGLPAPASTASAPSRVASSPCPSGKVQGFVNGVSMCYTPTNDTPQVKKDVQTQTSTNPDGSTTQTTTTNITTCTGAGSCTTVTTVGTSVTPAGGGTPTNTTATSTKSCVGSVSTCSPAGAGTGGTDKGTDSAFGGSCVANFTCSGDAVMCATARATNQTLCTLQTAPGTPEVSVYESAAASGTATAVVTRTRTIAGTDFDQSNALGVSGACIGDRSITVMGRTIVIEFSRVCPYIVMLGYVLFGIAFLIALRIVFAD